MDRKHWQKVLKAVEAEFEAAKTGTAVNAAAKRLQREGLS